MSLLAVLALCFGAGFVGAAVRDIYIWWLTHEREPLPPRQTFPYDHERDGV